MRFNYRNDNVTKNMNMILLNPLNPLKSSIMETPQLPIWWFANLAYNEVIAKMRNVGAAPHHSLWNVFCFYALLCWWILYFVALININIKGTCHCICTGVSAISLHLRYINALASSMRLPRIYSQLKYLQGCLRFCDGLYLPCFRAVDFGHS